MMNIHDDIRAQLRTILSPEATYEHLFRAVHSLEQHYSSACQQSLTEDLREIKRSNTESGMALSPHEALSCFADVWRTTKFLRGVYAAIQELQARRLDMPVWAIYAGTGPLAPLILPLFSLLEPGSVRFTLIDIHAESLDVAKSLIDSLGYHEFIEKYICCDASTYEIPSAAEVQLVISETMQAGLLNEPQVAIMLNFSQQLALDALFVPERITISAALADPSEIYDRPPEEQSNIFNEITQLGEVLNVSLDSLRELSKSKLIDESRRELPAASLHLNRSPRDSEFLTLWTEIQIYKEVVLKPYESGITFPVVVTQALPTRAEKINFRYHYDERPGFKIDWN